MRAAGQSFPPQPLLLLTYLDPCSNCCFSSSHCGGQCDPVTSQLVKTSHLLWGTCLSHCMEIPAGGGQPRTGNPLGGRAPAAKVQCLPPTDLWVLPTPLLVGLCCEPDLGATLNSKQTPTLSLLCCWFNLRHFPGRAKTLPKRSIHSTEREGETRVKTCSWKC